ncbi:hypothetical protein BOX15_Mlig006329g2 [Macrostomum lignano]|uniref:LRAT domain-containing protein n=1 Tax=Macrostomum lignano TaxID=282301 RepID=A0A267FR73_9PLAT|nr:hypothetical protein BOX15_Mlig006329g1 [Macrostomum lignano]PAA75734.1 hypothetical protein BOX15_Mlig006329g2 [Macrostomum lignano]
MCVGFTNGYSDFASDRVEEAIVAAVPGSAVSFNRIGFFHFAVFLGWAWPKGDDSEPIPLLCHLSGDASTKPVASVRLDDFRDIVQSCTIRVYNCKCSASKRSQVILNCLYLVGKAGYNPLTNNCEHFVREVICGQSTSYQAVWTLAAPLIQLPRILLGSAVVGAATSSASSNCASKFEENRSLGLLNPERDLIEIILSKHGLHLQGVKLNSVCTREFGGLSTFPMQFLYTCRSCSGSEKMAVCRPCQKLCHAKCIFRTGIVSENVCRCSHAMKSEAVQLPLQLDLQEESTSSVECDGSLSSSC